MNNSNIDTSKWGCHSDDAKRSASRRFLPLCEPIIITFPKGSTTYWSTVTTSTLACLGAALEHFEQSSRTLFGCHMQNKGFFWVSCVEAQQCSLERISLCKGWWWEPWQWHREACRPVSSSWMPLKSVLSSQELLLLHWHALADWLTRISSITSTIHSVPQHHTRHVASVCIILTINVGWIIQQPSQDKAQICGSAAIF